MLYLVSCAVVIGRQSFTDRFSQRGGSLFGSRLPLCVPLSSREQTIIFNMAATAVFSPVVFHRPPFLPSLCRRCAVTVSPSATRCVGLLDARLTLPRFSHSPPLFTVWPDRRNPFWEMMRVLLALHRRDYHHQHIHRRSSHRQALPSSEGNKGRQLNHHQLRDKRNALLMITGLSLGLRGQ